MQTMASRAGGAHDLPQPPALLIMDAEGVSLTLPQASLESRLQATFPVIILKAKSLGEQDICISKLEFP